MEIKLSCVNFYVEDVVKTLKFYSDAFGLATAINEEKIFGEVAVGENKLSFCAKKYHKIDKDSEYKSEPQKLQIPDSTLDGIIGKGALTEVVKAMYKERVAPPPPAPPSQSIVFEVENVDACFETAIAKGAQPYNKPYDTPWGQTFATIADPNGFIIVLSSKLKK